MENKVFLSIETSMHRIFLLLYNQGKVFHINKDVKISIETELNILIDELFKKAKLEYTCLKAVFVSLGPGSFTGTRVGLSAAKAISVALGKNLYGYSNFSTLYNQAEIKKKIPHKKKLCLLIRASKQEFYQQTYFKGKFDKMRVVSVKEIKNNYDKEIYHVGNFKNIHKIRNYSFCASDKFATLRTIEGINLDQYKENNSALLPLYVKKHYAER